MQKKDIYADNAYVHTHKYGSDQVGKVRKNNQAINYSNQPLDIIVIPFKHRTQENKVNVYVSIVSSGWVKDIFIIYILWLEY